MSEKSEWMRSELEIKWVSKYVVFWLFLKIVWESPVLGKQTNRELIKSGVSSFSEDTFLSSQDLSFHCEKLSFPEGREHACFVHHQYLLGPVPNSVWDKPDAQHVFVEHTVY